MDNVTDTKVVDAKENIQANTTPEQTTETPEQINWKKFREAREQDRKAKEAAEKDAAKKAEEVAALKAAMESLLNKPSPVTATIPEEDKTEDQKIQEKIDAALADRERKYLEERKLKEQQEFPSRLVSTFTDFNQVCSTENLDYLEYHYPEVAAPFKDLPDGFDKWSKIYKAVKRFVPNPDSHKDGKKADKNFSKPQSMAVGGITQTGDTAPHMLDDKRRADNWARMQRVMKGTR